MNRQEEVPGPLGPWPRRTKVANDIADTLRRQIVTGQRAQGERLPAEKELAAHFGVSQPTIREALRVLDVMGLVDIRHGSGTWVAGDSTRLLSQSLETLLQLESVGIGEILEVRRALAALTATQAARRATAEDLTALRKAQEGIDAARGASILERASWIVSFLDALSASAHNPLLMALESCLNKLLIQVQLRAWESRSTEFWSTWGGAASVQRRKIIAALEAKDEKGTADAMEAYHKVQWERLTADRELSRVHLSDASIDGALTIELLTTAERAFAAQKGPVALGRLYPAPGTPSRLRAELFDPIGRPASNRTPATV